MSATLPPGGKVSIEVDVALVGGEEEDVDGAEQNERLSDWLGEILR